MSDWLTARPIRSDPTDFDRVADAYRDRRSGLFSALAAVVDMRELFDAYGTSHSGPNIETIAAEGYAMADGLKSLIDGYDNLQWGFTYCAKGLRGLEEEITAPGGLSELRAEFETTGSGVDDSTVAGTNPEAAGEAEFDRLRTAETTLLKDLASKIEDAPTGELADLNNAKLDKILETIVANVKNPDIRMAANQAHYLLAAEDIADDTAGSSLDRTLHVDDVAKAMQEGIHPDDTEFADFFPPDYAEMMDLDRDIIPGLEAERDDAHNWQINPWDNDDNALAEINPQLAGARERRDELQKRLGADDAGKLSEVESVAALADHTGDREWEGQQYGEWTKIEGKPDAQDLEFVSEQVAEEADTAVAFFNELGPQGTAELPQRAYPGLASDEESERYDSTLDNFSIGFGKASKQRDEEGTARLGFTGAEVITISTDSDGEPLVKGHPELLFITGDFDQEFLVEATAASLREAEALPPIQHDRTGPWEFDPLREDPRNIMLDRVSENPDSAVAVVADLEKSGEVDLLLSPRVRFPPTAENWKYPPSDDNEYPITTFLTTVGADDTAARTIMLEVSTDPEPFSDPGVASGIDAIMAQHATITFNEDDLDPIGVEQSSINDGVDKDQQIQDTEWLIAHEKVLAFGEGRKLVGATERLYFDAITVATEGENIDLDIVEPFGIRLGALKTETDQAAITYYADLDEDARKQNEQAALASAAVFTVLPPLRGATFIVEENLGDPFSIPTDKEINELREQRAEFIAVDQDRATMLENYVYQAELARAAEDGTISVSIDGEVRDTELRQTNGGIYQIWDRDQNKYIDLPRDVNDDDYKEIFAPGTDTGNSVHQASDLNDSYMDGVLSTVEEGEEQQQVVERRSDKDYPSDGGLRDDGTAQANSNNRIDTARDQARENEVGEWVAEAPKPEEDDG